MDVSGRGLTRVQKLFSQNGCMMLYANQVELDNGRQHNDMRVAQGMELQEFSNSEIRNVLPFIKSQNVQGVKVIKAGQISDLVALQENLRQAFTNSGGYYIRSKVLGFNKTNKNVTQAIVEDNVVEGEKFLIAAGNASTQLTRNLGETIPMVGARGFNVTFENPGVQLDFPLIVSSQGLAITPTARGIRAVGLKQIGCNDTQNLTPFTRILISRVSALIPELNVNEYQINSGSRPLTPDSIPVIGNAKFFKNVYYAFGHGHWGITQASVTAQVIADLVQGIKPSIDTYPYQSSRF